MVFPDSPFTEKFNTSTIINLNTVSNSAGINEIPHLSSTLKWICQAPKVTSFRVNTLKLSTQAVLELLRAALVQVAESQEKSGYIPKVTQHSVLPDVILVDSYPEQSLDLEKREKEVIVDAACGAAVLRGAHVFAPGIMGMQTGTKVGDELSIYADITRQCKKGLPKKYDCPQKIFVGNGTAKMTRSEMFGDNLEPTGIAVEVTDNLSGCPAINETVLPVGSILLQNIPSIVCGHVLNPKPGEFVLDMCASPGNKTTHLAALMQNKGILIALDKTPTKVKQLKKKCRKFSLECVHTFEFDSTKSCNEKLEILLDNEEVIKGPPFLPESFDKILLDAPCSGLGNRPQLLNTITDKIVKSYVPLQRKLFTNAVSLLKKGGHLVYSTCTLTLGENEGMVAWALETFPCLELKLAEPILGAPGWSGTNLTPEQLKLLQRFGPLQQIDSIGFFIAHFSKKSS